MRSLTLCGLLLTVGCCFVNAADTYGFDANTILVPYDYSSPTGRQLTLKYLIKKGNQGAPVFYGVGGRVKVEDIEAQYDLFRAESDNYDKATVVYVEQRYFGDSIYHDKIQSLSDLSKLTLGNVISDHVALINKISTEMGTKNFLVFGAGHGGLIADYISNQFASVSNPNNLKVLAWSSSAPLKYLRRQGGTLPTTLKEITKQWKTRATLPSTGCADADIMYLSNFFDDLRSITNAATFTGTRLKPQPSVSGTSTGIDFSVDLRKVNVFLRNGILGFGFDDKLFKADGTPQTSKYNQFCTWIKAYKTYRTGTGTPAIRGSDINDLLNIIQPTGDVFWNPTDDASGKSNWPLDLSAQTWQDCTDYQIANCIDTDDTTDPFKNSEIVAARADKQKCTTDAELLTAIQTECQLLFTSGTTVPALTTFVAPQESTYPTSLKKNVIQTVDRLSVFGNQDFSGANNIDINNYAYWYKFWGYDQIEFESARNCDNDRLKQARYQILRAFGCFANIVQRDNDVCTLDKLFLNTGNDPDTDATQNCPHSNANFPWGQSPTVVFNNGPSTSTPLASTTGTSVTVTNPPVTTPTVSPTTHSGSSGYSTIFGTFLATALVWFIALSFH
ncbi:hypothetical protein M3Y94_01115300 [Aphelenchoides besseyi]|nr:hypothetical protein M3Y94_01115300 [Aphelenchoides besseyi]KAI6216773.1 Lysosomal Pro-X carboxypeptidase-like protein [Aphelenchoides besseyi]